MRKLQLHIITFSVMKAILREIYSDFIPLFIFQSYLCFSAIPFYLFYSPLLIGQQTNRLHDHLPIKLFSFSVLQRLQLVFPLLSTLSSPLALWPQLLFQLFVFLFSFGLLLAFFHQLQLELLISLILFCPFTFSALTYLLYLVRSSSSQTLHLLAFSFLSC